jgi:phosphocarrier protein
MALTASIELTNEVGLHARPSVKLTQLAKSFVCSVEIALDPDGPWSDAKSPVKVMRVKAPKGSLLHFRTEGSDEEAALRAMLELVAARFGEE